MGSSHSAFLPVPTEDVNELMKTTKFTHGEINYLYVRFRDLGVPGGRVRFLIKKDFAFLSTSMRSIIVGAMFGDKIRLTFVEFVKFLYHFRPYEKKMTPAERSAMNVKKLKLLFSMYDQDKNGEIDESDLLEIVHRLLSHYVNINSMLDIVSETMAEMDFSGTGKALFDDFAKVFQQLDIEGLAVKFPVILK